MSAGPDRLAQIYAAGVAAVIANLIAEIDVQLALCGCASIAAVTRDLVERA